MYNPFASRVFGENLYFDPNRPVFGSTVPQSTGNSPAFRASAPIDRNFNNPHNVSATDDCAICMEPLNNGDPICYLANCRHIFHHVCVSNTLSPPFTNVRCPLCRTNSPNTGIVPININNLVNGPVAMEMDFGKVNKLTTLNGEIKYLRQL
jgi:hypothetical protein